MTVNEIREFLAELADGDRRDLRRGRITMSEVCHLCAIAETADVVAY